MKKDIDEINPQPEESVSGHFYILSEYHKSFYLCS